MSLKKRTLAEMLRSLAIWLVYGLIFFLPIFFLPFSLDILEVNKQTLLVILSLLAALAWFGSMLAERRFQFKGGWMNLWPALLFLCVFISSLLSLGPYLSWVGASKQEYTSLLSLFGFVTLFYVVTNIMQSEKTHRAVHGLLLLGASGAGLVGVFGLLGMPITAFDAADLPIFNTIGTINAFAIYMAAMTVFAVTLFVAHLPKSGLLHPGWRGGVESSLIFLVSGLGLITLLIVDYTAAWVVFIIGLLILFGFTLVRFKDFRRNTLVLPIILLTAALPFLFFFDSPFDRSLPVEVTPSFASSLDIATSTLTDTNPLFGSGPGTFLYDYAKYHGTDVNATEFWNSRFDRGASFALTVLATMGTLGAILWLIFLVFTILRSLMQLLRADSRKDWLHTFLMLTGFATLASALFAYSANMTHLFLVFLFAGLIGSQVMPEGKEFSFAKKPRLALGISFIFVLLAIAIVSVIFITSQRAIAESAFAEAVRADRRGEELSVVLTGLDRAAQLNRYNDLYYRNLAQALLLRLGEELEHSTAVDTSAEHRQFIQALTGAAINSAVRATNLAPNNVSNWTARGSIYRELIELIGNAGQFSANAYQRATELEPSNPAHQVELGKTYLSLAEQARTLTAAQDEQVRTDAMAEVEILLAKAEGAFLKAIELKSDFAPAHFQSALVLERQGRLDEAVGKMESVARHNQFDVGVAFQLGLLYLRRGAEGDLDRAENAFAYAVELSPSYSNARWFLASIHEQKGEVNKAIEQILKVLSLNPGNKIVQARLENLKNGLPNTEIPESLDAGSASATTVPDGQPTEGAPESGLPDAEPATTF